MFEISPSFSEHDEGDVLRYRLFWWRLVFFGCVLTCGGEQKCVSRYSVEFGVLV